MTIDNNAGLSLSISKLSGSHNHCRCFGNGDHLQSTRGIGGNHSWTVIRLYLDVLEATTSVHEGTIRIDFRAELQLGYKMLHLEQLQWLQYDPGKRLIVLNASTSRSAIATQLT